MFRSVLLMFLAAFTLTAAAQDDANQIATEALHKIAPNAKVQSVRQAPLAGFYSVVADGHPILVSSDGKYLIEGHVVDIAAKRDIMEDGLAGVRRAALAAIAADKKVTFAPPHPKHRVTVFTDVDCPYCRIFHSHIAEYNKLGIAVDYLFWPRSGLDTPSYDKAVSVWCASDRKRAFSEAKHGLDPKPAHCDNPVAHDYQLGIDLGVDGTPTIIAVNGAALNGYADPIQLLQWLSEVPGPRDGG